MFHFIEGYQVYLACGYTDMRKSINGLSAIVERDFCLDPYSKALFVFCNRQRNRLKILTWEDNGFWIHFKRLELGHFSWPLKEESNTFVLTIEELTHLIRGPGVVQKIKGNQLIKS